MDLFVRCQVAELELTAKGMEPRTAQAAVRLVRKRVVNVLRKLSPDLQDRVGDQLFTAELALAENYGKAMSEATARITPAERARAYAEGYARRGIEVGPETLRKVAEADFLR